MANHEAQIKRAGTQTGRPEDVVRAALECAFRARGMVPASAPPFAAAIADGQRVRTTAATK